MSSTATGLKPVLCFLTGEYHIYLEDSSHYPGLALACQFAYQGAAVILGDLKWDANFGPRETGLKEYTYQKK